MEPQKIEYPKNIAIRISGEEARNLIRFLEVKNYDISFYSELNIFVDVTYDIKEKKNRKLSKFSKARCYI